MQASILRLVISIWLQLPRKQYWLACSSENLVVASSVTKFILFTPPRRRKSV